MDTRESLPVSVPVINPLISVWSPRFQPWLLVMIHTGHGNPIQCALDFVFLATRSGNTCHTFYFKQASLHSGQRTLLGRANTMSALHGERSVLAEDLNQTPCVPEPRLRRRSVSILSVRSVSTLDDSSYENRMNRIPHYIEGKDHRKFKDVSCSASEIIVALSWENHTSVASSSWVLFDKKFPPAFQEGKREVLPCGLGCKFHALPALSLFF